MGNTDTLDGGVTGNTAGPADAAVATASTARLVYILYLVGLLFGPAAIAGVIIAYVNMSGAPVWLQSHYCFQIRTFWIGALFLLLGILTTLLLVGYLVLLLWAVWVIVRCAKGLQALDRKETYPNPVGWMC
jgi:uncharacterized membrane protein